MMHNFFRYKFLLIFVLAFSVIFSKGFAQLANQPNANANSPVQANQNGVSNKNQPKSDSNQASANLASNEENLFGYPDITSQAAVLVFLALLPFLIMLLTSFVKIVITLSLLRNAIGVQQTPPNQVVNGIALILTLYVMFPTGMAMYNNSKHLLDKKLPSQLFSGESATLVIDMIDAAKEPLRDFLIRNTTAKHQDGFYKLAQKSFPEEVKTTLTPNDFIIVVPSFITSQIRAAFEIGVLIYLPFFVIDLVTSNILLAMQMMMLSPLSISLPLKLLLVVMIDGWTILVQGLVLSFN